MRAAWHVEAFARTKRLPKLKDILIKIGPPIVMTEERAEMEVRAWLSSIKRTRQ